MNFIWAALMLLSIACAFVTGKINDLTGAVITGASDAVNFVISILGMMAFWTGIMKIAESSGITSILSHAFSPIIKILFPDLPPNSSAVKNICMNITANLLGLGNAATPFGISAMKEMKKLNPLSNTATNSMIMFLVINTASLQLVPTFLCILRQKYGAQNPADIIVCVWITSLVALITGVIFTKIFERIKKYE